MSSTENIVTPWEVKGNVDYEKLVKNFGTELITEEQIKRIYGLTGEIPHHYLRRSLFFSHRALDEFLDAYEHGEPVFLYTGRGPTSDSLHIGHTISFVFTAWLQKAFKCPVVIQIADDEKYAFKNMPFSKIYDLGFENAKDIVAFGFDSELTYIFSNRDYRLQVPEYEIFVSELKTKISTREVSSIFGFDRYQENITKEQFLELLGDREYISKEELLGQGKSTVAMYDWPFYQSAAAFSNSFPHIFGNKKAHCLVAYGIDQDNYFRMARDLADKLNLIKPYSIMCQFIPPLTGTQGKMSSSTGMESSIFLTDSEDVIRSKIKKYAFSGSNGNGSMEDFLKFGGNSEIDVSYQYLKYFEEDDSELERVKTLFESGSPEMTCSKLKELLSNKLVEFTKKHQELRSKVSIETFYQRKSLVLNTKEFIKEYNEDQSNLLNLLNVLKINYETRHHKPIETMEEGKNIALTLNGTVCKNLIIETNHSKMYLVITDFNKNINLKILAKALETKSVKFSNINKVTDLFRIPRGAVSVLGLINYSEIEVLIDMDIRTELVNFHPLRNDTTLTIKYIDMLRFIEHFKVPYKILEM